MAKHLDLAAITPVSSARGLGHFVWRIDWLYTTYDGTHVCVRLQVHTKEAGIDSTTFL